MSVGTPGMGVGGTGRRGWGSQFRAGPTGRHAMGARCSQGCVRIGGLHPGLFSMAPSGSRAVVSDCSSAGGELEFVRELNLAPGGWVG